MRQPSQATPLPRCHPQRHSAAFATNPASAFASPGSVQGLDAAADQLSMVTSLLNANAPTTDPRAEVVGPMHARYTPPRQSTPLTPPAFAISKSKIADAGNGLFTCKSLAADVILWETTFTKFNKSTAHYYLYETGFGPKWSGDDCNGVVIRYGRHYLIDIHNSRPPVDREMPLWYYINNAIGRVANIKMKKVGEDSRTVIVQWITLDDISWGEELLFRYH